MQFEFQHYKSVSVEKKKNLTEQWGFANDSSVISITAEFVTVGDE
jgi:hypothetical protein